MPCVHLNEAIFISESLLILLLPAQHWFPPKIVSSEKPLKQHVVCQTSDEPQLKPMLMRFFQVGWQCLKAE